MYRQAGDIRRPRVPRARQIGQILVVVAIGILLLLPATAIADEQPAPPVTFEDASAALQGFTHTNIGAVFGDNVTGVAWLDCDNDGDLDLYIANGVGADDGLLINDGNGGFSNSTGISAGDIGDQNGSSGVAAADLNNDGFTDIIVTGDNAFLKGLPSAKQIRVYKNNGACNFSDVTDDGFDSIGPDAGSALQVSLGDINNDGLLDIFIAAPSSLTTVFVPANRLFLNNGGFDFQDISAGAGDAIYAAAACDSAFTHYDDDGYIDLVVGDCNAKLPRDAVDDFLTAAGLPPGALPPFASTPIRLLKNNGDNSFTRLDVNLPEPPAPADQAFPPVETGFWMAVTLGDIDADGDLDLFSSNVGEFFNFGGPGLEQNHYLGERLDDGTFAAIEGPAGITNIATKFAWGASFADFNNDGWEDLFVAGNLPELGVQVGNPGYLFVNNHDKTFRNDPQPVDLSLRYSTGVAVADYDNDGRVDIVISNGRIDVAVVVPGIVNIQPADDQPTLLRNVSDTGNNWVTVKLVGTTSNRDAIGAQVKVKSKGVKMLKEVRAGEGWLSTSSPWQTFGLGHSNKQKVKVLVRWPLGLIEEFNVRTQRIATVVEGTGKTKKKF